MQGKLELGKDLEQGGGGRPSWKDFHAIMSMSLLVFMSFQHKEVSLSQLAGTVQEGHLQGEGTVTCGIYYQNRY